MYTSKKQTKLFLKTFRTEIKNGDYRNLPVFFDIVKYTDNYATWYMDYKGIRVEEQATPYGLIEYIVIDAGHDIYMSISSIVQQYIRNAFKDFPFSAKADLANRVLTKEMKEHSGDYNDSSNYFCSHLGIQYPKMFTKLYRAEILALEKPEDVLEMLQDKMGEHYFYRIIYGCSV
jgi:hypothetical protein